MGIKKRPDFSRMKTKLRSGINEAIGQFVSDYKEDIQTSALNKGKNVDGQSFKSYSKQYGAWKTRKTRVNSAKVNLSLSGNMLKAIRSQVVNTGQKLIGKVYVDSSFEAEKVRWNNEKRRFFFISKKAQKKFTELMASVLGDAIK